MADTLRTQADLLTALFQDGQTAGISANDIRDLTVSTMGAYGGISQYDEAGAAISTATIGATFQVVDQFDADDASDGVTADSTTDNDLTIGTGGDGDYMINFYCSFEGTNTALYTFKLVKNAAEQLAGCTRYIGTGTDIGSTSFSAILALVATDTVSVHVKADGAAKVFKTYQLGLNIKRIG